MRLAWLLGFFLALPHTIVCAQERRDPQQAVQQIEQAVRRRVESWLRERSPGKLNCPTCKGERYSHPPCESCKGTGINPHRIDNAFWRYTRPSYRRGRDRDEWIQERVFGGRDRAPARWGGHPAVVDGAKIDAIEVSRDAVHVIVALSESGRGWGERPQMDAWVREERAYYIDLSNEPAEELVKHDWFVLGTFSVNRFEGEVDRLSAEEDRPNLTDLERAQLRRDREKTEEELRTRVVADLGTIVNVRKETGFRRDHPPSFEVVVRIGTLDLRLVMAPTEEQPVEMLEERLAGLSQGTRVFFRGQPREWRRSHEYLGLADLVLTNCEIEPLQ